MTHSQRLVVLADDGGNVMAGHYVAEQTGHLATGMRALPGQSLHEVDVPSELVDAAPEDALRGLGTYRVQAGALVRKES
jgi:hypothetical protein